MGTMGTQSGYRSSGRIHLCDDTPVLPLGPPLRAPAGAAVTIVQMAILGVAFPVWYLAWHKEKPLSWLGITRNRWIPSLVVGIILAALFLPRLVALYPGPGLLPHLIVNGCMFWEPFFVFGWLPLSFDRAFGIIPGILFSSLAFGAYHIGTYPGRGDSHAPDRGNYLRVHLQGDFPYPDPLALRLDGLLRHGNRDGRDELQLGCGGHIGRNPPHLSPGDRVYAKSKPRAVLCPGIKPAPLLFFILSKILPPSAQQTGAGIDRPGWCCVAQLIMSAGLRFIRYPVLIKNNGKEQALG